MQQFGPFLIVVPLSTLPAWQMQIAQWAPALNVITYIGNAQSREIIRESEFGPIKKLRFNALLTTYEFVLKDRQCLSPIKWQYLAVDEVNLSLWKFTVVFPKLTIKHRHIDSKMQNLSYTMPCLASTVSTSFLLQARLFRTTFEVSVTWVVFICFVCADASFSLRTSGFDALFAS